MNSFLYLEKDYSVTVYYDTEPEIAPTQDKSKIIYSNGIDTFDVEHFGK